MTVSDSRGAVYVEFLLAFFPLFLLFLALCQLALVGAAEAMVRHSAYAAARSAIVVLEDEPERFDGAARGSLSEGRPKRVRNVEHVTAKLGIERTPRTDDSRARGSILDFLFSQNGARMVPIETAAFLPLLPLAPNERNVVDSAGSISSALGNSSARQLGFAVLYTKAAALVTLHDSEVGESPAKQPIPPDAPVTTRVTYLFHCTIPVVRSLLCRPLGSIAKQGLLGMALVQQTEGFFRADARFKVLSATATLPNQGAGYLSEDEE
jgi:hypothetical protein